ncbi:MAG TPA: R3H domain-containing nucleic acid-binding protein [bacterium]
MRPQRQPDVNMSKIDSILIDIQRKLRDSLQPYCVENLNSFERKRIHDFFDNKEDFETRTYRQEEQYVLKVIPVGNLKRLAKEITEKVLENGDPAVLPYVGSYERYIIHNYLKDFEGIETKSIGEGLERRLEIKPLRFGRALKKIIKKIKLF